MKIILKKIIPYAISILCMVYVLWGIDYEILLEAFKAFHILPLIVAQIVILLAYAPLSARLRFIAHNKISFPTSVHASFLCVALNTILPAKLGEAAKAVIVSREAHLSFQQALGIVFWERFADINALLIMTVIASSYTSFPLIILPLAALVLTFWMLLVLLAIWPQLILKPLSRLPWENVKSRCKELVFLLTKELRWTFMLPVSIYTILIWALGVSGYIMIIGFGTDVSIGWWQIFIIFIVGTMGFTIPAAPAGLGVFESFVVGGLLFYGIPKEQGLAIAVVLRLIYMFVPTLIGLQFFRYLSDSSLDMINKLKGTNFLKTKS